MFSPNLCPALFNALFQSTEVLSFDEVQYVNVFFYGLEKPLSIPKSQTSVFSSEMLLF